MRRYRRQHHRAVRWRGDTSCALRSLTRSLRPYRHIGDPLTKSPAAAAPESTHVVKAFKTIFRDVLAQDKPVDAFFAGDNAEAKAIVTSCLESLGIRPLDAGGLEMASVLEWAGILLVGLAANGAGFDIAFGAKAL